MGDFFNFRKNKEEKGNGSQKKDSDRKFYSKISDLFSAEPQKEKVLRHEDFNGAGDVYYASVSAAYKIASRILLLLLVILLLACIVHYKLENNKGIKNNFLSKCLTLYITSIAINSKTENKITYNG